MKHGHRFLMVALIAGMLAAALALPAAGGEGALAAQPTIIYVDAEAVGRDDGTTWKNAYRDLQDALNEAEPLNQIWVAAGTYKPTQAFLPGDDPRLASFQMVNSVAVYGGFKPDKGVTKFDERDWVAYETILSGDLGTAGDPSDNSYHVWHNPLEVSLDESAIVDGFIISDGNANEPDYPYGLCGGGVLSVGLSPNWRNITFLNNAAVYGGAFWVSAPYPEETTVTLTNVTFVGNWATEGGGAFVDGREAIPGETGGVTFVNCIFRDNVAERGGAVAVALGEPAAVCPEFRLVFCTLSGNQAESGGGAYVSEESKGMGWFMVTNSILWGNYPEEIYVEDGASPPLVTYSDIQGGYDGEGNIDEDPEFVNPEVGDLHLQLGSPCIDWGDSGGPSLPPYDFDGDERVMDGDCDGEAIVDLGADEVKCPYPVEISITPYIPTNVIRLRPGVVVDVAILSTDYFDAVAEVAADTVEFAGATHVGFDYVDVNEDDLVDVLLDFRTEDMVDLNEDSTEATLTGFTLEGVPFEGTGEVKVR